MIQFCKRQSKETLQEHLGKHYHKTQVDKQTDHKTTAKLKKKTKIRFLWKLCLYNFFFFCITYFLCNKKCILL